MALSPFLIFRWQKAMVKNVIFGPKKKVRGPRIFEKMMIMKDISDVYILPRKNGFRIYENICADMLKRLAPSLFFFLGKGAKPNFCSSF